MQTTQWVSIITYLLTMHELQKHCFTVHNVCNVCFYHWHFTLHSFAIINKYKKIFTEENRWTKINVSLLAEKKKTLRSCFMYFLKSFQSSSTFKKNLRYSHSSNKLILHNSFCTWLSYFFFEFFTGLFKCNRK